MAPSVLPGHPTTTRALLPLSLKPTDRPAIFASRSKRILWQSLQSLVRALPPVPGYFPDKLIFPGFPIRKFAVISPAMRGRDVPKYLIQKRYPRQDWRLLGPIGFFRGNFPVRSGMCSPATGPKGAPRAPLLGRCPHRNLPPRAGEGREGVRSRGSKNGRSWHGRGSRS
jgi:hypothetical protein